MSDDALPLDVTISEDTEGARWSNASKVACRGLVLDEWPCELDMDVQYQDWILVAASMFAFWIFFLPCLCSRMPNPCSRAFAKAVYTHLHVFFTVAIYFDLLLLMIIIGILPNWTVNEYLENLILFITWVLVHLQKLIECAFIVFGFFLVVRFRDRLLLALGMEHATIFRWSWTQMLGFSGKRRPVEIMIWKVEGLASNARKVKANDIFVEVHFGHNEPMRTRVHNNAGSTCNIRQSFQVNIDENATSSIMTLMVKDQNVIANAEIGRLMLSTRELFGIEDQTGKRRTNFEYSEDSFVPLDLSPSGKIWIAIAPVYEMDDDEQTPLMQDSLLNC